MRAKYFVRELVGTVAGVVLGIAATALPGVGVVSAKSLQRSIQAADPQAHSVDDARLQAAESLEPKLAPELRLASLTPNEVLHGGAVVRTPISFGQTGQVATIDAVSSSTLLRGGAALAPAEFGSGFTTRIAMSAIPYRSAAAAPMMPVGFPEGERWFARQTDTSDLARHMEVHEPQRVISSADSWLMLLVGVMLVVYQLRRKHIFLRPKPFGF